MIRRYAQNTAVPVDRTRSEIQHLIERHGAKGFIFGHQEGLAMIAFEMRERRLKFVLPLPLIGTKHWPKNTSEAQLKAEIRRRWRALLLVLKAKLEAVASDIVSFDTEFLAFIVLPGGLTVGEDVAPQLPELLLGKTMRPLLEAGAP